MTDVTTVTHRPRSAGSQLTVSSGSSIASGISQDIELGSRSSAAAPNGVASITRNYAARSSTGGVRRREFKARHIQMMSLGATIGVGLLYQSGKALYSAGPVPFLLSYMVMGTVIYSVLITLGEMVSYLPLPGGWFALANRALNPSLGFAFGWVYWFTYLVGFPAKLVAATSTMTFWIPADQINPAVWISLYAAIPIAFNMFNVRRYGEIEFWLATIKVTAFVGIIISGILLPLGASSVTRLLGTDTNHVLIPCDDPASDNCVSPPGFIYWKQSAFKEFLTTGALGRLAGFWLCCCQAAFAFTGTEIIGITANEAEQPRTTLPHAVRRIVKRLVFYYIGAAFVLGINLSANDPQLAWYVNNPKGSYQGPFVLMMQRANIPVLSHILNSVVLIACLSVANANLYETSRALYALACEGHAPRIFLKKNMYEVPWVGVLVSALPGALAYLSLGAVSPNSVFDFLVGMTTVGGLISWAAICATYLRFRRAYMVQQINVVQAAKSPLQPVLAWYGLVWTTFLTIFQGYLTFARYNPYWGIVSTSWGYTVGPWILIAVFFGLIAAWLIKTRITQERWTWQTRNLDRVDLARGVAPEPIRRKGATAMWRRIIQRVLEAI